MTQLTSREKAIRNRDKAARLNEEWGLGAAQCRYSDDGHWYARLVNFPAALFDANGYVLFATEEDLRNSPNVKIGKQISIKKPGISTLPGYVRRLDSAESPAVDLDIHTTEAEEGQRRLVLHLQRERNRSLVLRKKEQASSLHCEICGFLFADQYGTAACDYCEVHHLVPLSEVEQSTRTRLQDLAILCANCHRVVHLQNPPYTLARIIHEEDRS